MIKYRAHWADARIEEIYVIKKTKNFVSLVARS